MARLRLHCAILISLLIIMLSKVAYAECLPITDVYDNIGIVNCDSYLNIRNSASLSSDVVGLLPNNGVFEVIKEYTDWVWIKSGTVRGYVLKEYVLLGEEAQLTAMEKSYEQLKVLSPTPIYAGKSESKIWEYAATGAIYDVLSLDSGFFEVDLDGTSAYVKEDEHVKYFMGLPEASNTYDISGVSADRKKLVTSAMKYLGNNYVWGGNDPNTGADCSGYVRYLYKNILGIQLPRCSYEQCYSGVGVRSLDMLPGDLIFYAGASGKIGHVAMYIGNGTIIHAASSKSGIKLSNWNYRTPIYIRRIIDEANN